MTTTTTLETSPATAIRSALLRVTPSASSPPAGLGTGGLLEALFREQQTLTAVDRFAHQHDSCGLPAASSTYRELIPLDRPGPGQQLAFEVDLDSCTGCKACVTACHSLNGLDEGEVWRTVGLLHGGTPAAPAQQTVTSACHHCVEPACMTGCPVGAYEKDAVTGIVRHLDDQCIGCQYCTLMCPYDAPKYSPSRGIVRKCDMCSHRLAVGEAPACVQGCPNEAIAIRIVDRLEVLQASLADVFVPGAPAPDKTLPTTVYRSKRPVPPAMLPADFYAVSAEHGHPPLVIMLVLTQLAVGALVAAAGARQVYGLPTAGAWALSQVLLALGVATAAMAVSVLHLGRPLLAWRAFLGLRTSWLSREIIAFSLFGGAAAAHALSLAAPRLPALSRLPGLALLAALRPAFEVAAVASGLAGVACSVMVYAATRRAHWRVALTGPRFFGTTLLLGLASVTALSTLLAGPDSGLGPAMVRTLLLLLVACATLKLGIQALALAQVHRPDHTVGKRVALLMMGDLARPTVGRFACGVVGGLILPVAMMAALPPALAAEGFGPGLRVAAVAALLLLVASELCERYLFFKAAPPSRMPGGLP